MPDDSLATSAEVLIRPLGRTAYTPTWHAMQAVTLARTPESSDEIWITEHDSVYTLGLAGRAEHLRRANGIPVLKVDRGGQVTYHGPGQLVLYVLIDLKRRHLGIRTLVRALEGAVIDWLSPFGIAAYGKQSAPGVYVRLGGCEAKIGALGLRVRNGCTYHGLAVNIAMDLSPFADIDPCGYAGLAVTQVADLATPPSLEAGGEALAPCVARRIVEASR